MDLLDAARRSATAPLVLAALLTGCGHLPVIVVLSTDPLSAEEHTRLGASYEVQGLKKDAFLQYEAALEKDPKYVPALMAEGEASIAAGDDKSAEISFRKVLKIAPRHAGASNDLALIYIARNIDLPEAERLAQDALAQDGPFKPYLYDTLANIYLRQKRYFDARSAVDLAQAAAPPDNAAIHERLLQTRAAIDAARAAEGAHPND